MTRHVTRVLLSASILSLVAMGCSNVSSEPGQSEEPEATPEPEPDPFPPPESPGVQFSSGKIAVGAYEEKTLCVFVDLPNPEEIQVVQFEQKNSGYVHHFILYKNGDPRAPGMGECPDMLFLQSPVIYPGTRDQGPFLMPDGVGLPLAAQQPLILELHLLNAFEEPVEEEIFINLHARGPDVELERAGVLGGSDFTFEIPPFSQHTEVQRCYILSDLNLGGGINVFALTSHSHERTLSFDVRVSQPDGPLDVYHSEDWQEPEVAHYDPPLEVHSLSWFEFSCTWENLSSESVSYGPTADDEMCMMFGYFYPARTSILPCAGL